MSLSLDDFEWAEDGFDDWRLTHNVYAVTIARLLSFNGWRVSVLDDDCQHNPLHVDSFDAAKALAQMIANQHMEHYHGKYLNGRPLRKRVKTDGPPTFRAGIFKVD